VGPVPVPVGTVVESLRYSPGALHADRDGFVKGHPDLLNPGNVPYRKVELHALDLNLRRASRAEVCSRSGVRPRRLQSQWLPIPPNAHSAALRWLRAPAGVPTAPQLFHLRAA